MGSDQLTKARGLFNQKRYSEAEPIYREVLRGDPDNHVCLFELASSLYNLGQVEQSVPFYRRAFQVRSDVAVYAYWFANALHRGGSTSEAQQYFLIAHSLDPAQFQAPDLPSAQSQSESVFGVTTLTVPLSPKQQEILLVYEDDCINANPVILQRGEHRIIEPITTGGAAPGAPGGGGTTIGERSIQQEYLFKSVATNFHGRFVRTYRLSQPYGIEQIGNQAIILWYYCKRLNIDYPIGGVGYLNGQTWVDTTFSVYDEIEKATARGKLLAVATLGIYRKRSQIDQRKLIAFLVSDLLAHRGAFSRYFEGQPVEDSGRL